MDIMRMHWTSFKWVINWIIIFKCERQKSILPEWNNEDNVKYENQEKCFSFVALLINNMK